MPYLTAEFDRCFYLLDDILDGLQDIKLALTLNEELTSLLDPPFDPLKTFGKYV